MAIKYSDSLQKNFFPLELLAFGGGGVQSMSFESSVKAGNKVNLTVMKQGDEVAKEKSSRTHTRMQELRAQRGRHACTHTHRDLPSPASLSKQPQKQGLEHPEDRSMKTYPVCHMSGRV